MRTYDHYGNRQAKTVANRRKFGLIFCTTSLFIGFFTTPPGSAADDKSVSMAPLVPPSRSPRPVPSGLPTRRDIQSAAQSTYPRSHYQRAMYLKQKGHIDGALVEFLKATQDNPRQVQAFYEQALIFRDRGYRKLAESALEQALAVNPGYQQGRILLATIRLEQGNLGGAVSELSRSLGIPDKQPTGRNRQLETAEPAAGLGLSPAETEPPPAKLPSVMQTPHSLIEEPTEPGPEPSLNPREYVDQTKTRMQSPTPSAQPPAPAVAPASELPQLLSKDQREPEKEVPGAVRKVTLDHPIDLKSLLVHKPRFGFRLPSWNPFRFFGRDWIPERPLPSGTRKQSQQMPSRSRLLSRLKPRRGALAAAANPPASAPSAPVPMPIIVHQPVVPIGQPAPVAPVRQEPAPPQARQLTPSSTPAPIMPPSLPHVVRMTFEPETAPTAVAAAVSAPTAQPRSVAKPIHPAVVAAPAVAFQPAAGDDEWTRKLKYYAQHGTATLMPGEAFMFSEDTGEAVLFRHTGETVRRQIAPRMVAQEVVSSRRPDLTAPPTQDLNYNLSLLGKLMPQNEPQSPAQPPITMDQLMKQKEGLMGWIKGIFRMP